MYKWRVYEGPLPYKHLPSVQLVFAVETRACNGWRRHARDINYVCSQPELRHLEQIQS